MLVDICGATIVQKINGLDQWYWDFQLEGVTIVLYLEHYLGICVYVEDGTHEELLRSTVQALIDEKAHRTKPCTGRRDRRP